MMEPPSRFMNERADLFYFLSGQTAFFLQNLSIPEYGVQGSAKFMRQRPLNTCFNVVKV